MGDDPRRGMAGGENDQPGGRPLSELADEYAGPALRQPILMFARLVATLHQDEAVLARDVTPADVAAFRKHLATVGGARGPLAPHTQELYVSAVAAFLGPVAPQAGLHPNAYAPRTSASPAFQEELESQPRFGPLVALLDEFGGYLRAAGVVETNAVTFSRSLGVALLRWCELNDRLSSLEFEPGDDQSFANYLVELAAGSADPGGEAEGQESRRSRGVVMFRRLRIFAGTHPEVRGRRTAFLQGMARSGVSPRLRLQIDNLLREVLEPWAAAKRYSLFDPHPGIEDALEVYLGVLAQGRGIGRGRAGIALELAHMLFLSTNPSVVPAVPPPLSGDVREPTMLVELLAQALAQLFAGPSSALHAELMLRVISEAVPDPDTGAAPAVTFSALVTKHRLAGVELNAWASALRDLRLAGWLEAPPAAQGAFMWSYSARNQGRAVSAAIDQLAQLCASPRRVDIDASRRALVEAVGVTRTHQKLFLRLLIADGETPAVPGGDDSAELAHASLWLALDRLQRQGLTVEGRFSEAPHPSPGRRRTPPVDLPADLREAVLAVLHPALGTLLRRVPEDPQTTDTPHGDGLRVAVRQMLDEATPEQLEAACATAGAALAAADAVPPGVLEGIAERTAAATLTRVHGALADPEAMLLLLTFAGAGPRVQEGGWTFGDLAAATNLSPQVLQRLLGVCLVPGRLIVQTGHVYQLAEPLALQAVLQAGVKLLRAAGLHGASLPGEGPRPTEPRSLG